MHLEPDDIEAIAERVVARLTRESRPRARIGLVTAADVAELYGVSVSWVYERSRPPRRCLARRRSQGEVAVRPRARRPSLGMRAPAPSPRRPPAPAEIAQQRVLLAGVELLQARGRT